MEFSSPLSLILLCLIAIAFGVGFFFARFRVLPDKQHDDSSVFLLQQQIEHMRGHVSQSLDANAQLVQRQVAHAIDQVNDRLRENAQVLAQTQQSLGQRLDNAARVVGNVQKSLGTLEEANRKIFEVGKDIASLQDILRAPKLRGGLGEFLLGDLLAQTLPTDQFVLQHAFRSGERVDAAIRLGESLVPIDAKFPLENFRRILQPSTEPERAQAKRQFGADVRRHVDAIASKYIVPDEGTYDFALMYIPAENVYYEIVIKDDAMGDHHLGQYALSKRVIPVSPNTLYAYLQAIVWGLKGLRIEEKASDILACLSRLKGDFAKFRDDFAVLGKHLGHAQATYQIGEKRLDRLGQKLLSADLGQAPDDDLVETPRVIRGGRDV